MRGNKKYCKYCGRKINIELAFCNFCEKQVEEVKSSKLLKFVPLVNDYDIATWNGKRKRKNIFTALFLCIFLGWFGAHKFYEGKRKQGILYLCTFGLCGVGVLLDLIILLDRRSRYYDLNLRNSLNKRERKFKRNQKKRERSRRRNQKREVKKNL